MAEFPHMPLATDAYLADTTHLRTIEHGAYMLLLMTAWRTPGVPRLPNDDRLLARYAGLNMSTWLSMRDTVLTFWDLGDDGFWTQKKQLAVRQRVQKVSQEAKEKAAKRWNAKPLENKGSADAVALPDASRAASIQNQTLLREKEEEPNGSLSEAGSDPIRRKPSRSSYPADFEAAWGAYPTTKNMSKAEALPAWRKLSAEDRAAVAKSIPGYLAFLKSKPDLETIHFVRYLSKRRFDGYVEGADLSVDAWTNRLDWARKNRKWSAGEWGPPPGSPGCHIPASVLRPDDGVGWAEFAA